MVKLTVNLWLKYFMFNGKFVVLSPSGGGAVSSFVKILPEVMHTGSEVIRPPGNARGHHLYHV